MRLISEYKVLLVELLRELPSTEYIATNRLAQFCVQ